MSTSTLDKSGTATGNETNSAEAWKAQRECQEIRSDIKRKLTSAVADTGSLFTVNEMRQWEKGMTDGQLEVVGFKDPEKKAQALREYTVWMENCIREASEWGNHFFGAINDAVRSGALTEENARHAKDVAYRRNTDWPTVKKFFTGSGPDTFASWKSNWQYMTELQRKIKDLQQKINVPTNALPELVALRSSQGKFEKRLDLAQKAVSVLAGLETKNRAAYTEAKTMLKSAVSAKALAAGKVDAWLAHIFTKYKGPAAFRFIENTLPSFVEDWKDIASDYRHFKKECDARKITAIEENAFLSLPYEQRKQEVMKMRRALNGTTESQETMKDASYLKMRIRFTLATEDWETADELVRKLEFGHPDDPEGRSFRKEVEKLKAKNPQKPGMKTGQEKPPLPELQKQIWGFLGQIGDPNMRSLMESALVTQDLDVIEGMMQMLYNRFWCRKHGYLDDHREQTEAKKEENKEKTKEYQENGHTRYIERNIVAGDTADESSIRLNNHKAQLIYIANEESAHVATVNRIKQHKHEKNGGLRYWGTIVTMDSMHNVNNYEHTKHFVETIYYPMRSVIRNFVRQGGKYQRRGAAPTNYQRAQAVSNN